MEVENNEQEIRIAMSSLQENIKKLYEAAEKGCIESLKRLIEEDPYIIQKVVITSSSNNNETHHPLLHVSISNGHLEFTRLLIHYEPQLVAEVDLLQRTPLHLASQLGETEIVETLLEKNMNTCFVYDNDGLIPLHYAILSRQTDIMQMLIKARPRSLWMKLKNNGQTVLYLCVESNHLKGMKFLIETYVNDDEDFLNTIDDNGNTILDLSMMLGQRKMVGYLLSALEVKTETSIITNLEASDDTNESLELQKLSKTRDLKGQKSRKHGLKNTTKLRWRAWRMNLKYKGDWFQEVQGTMMLVATVIATVTFQAGVNPPGGVWQQDTPVNSSSYFNNNPYYRPFNSSSYFNNDPYYRPFNSSSYFSYNPCYRPPLSNVFPAGTAIMKYLEPCKYMYYIRVNTISFLASISVILLIVGRFPLKNKICSWLLALAMCVAVVTLGKGYFYGVKMVNDVSGMDDSFGVFCSLYFLAISCLGLVRVAGVWHILSFKLWIVKTLFSTFISKLKFYCFKRTTP